MHGPARALVACLALTVAAAPTRAQEICVGYGPQAPRDIDQRAGENPGMFSLAPPPEELSLCNIHFHAQAEHRAAGFSLTTPGKGGYQCEESTSLTAAEKAPFDGSLCQGVEAGDTIEVHWVHTSCDVDPGPGLGSCLSDACANPNVRVEAQVFLVVNDSEAVDFGQFVHDGHRVGTLPQAKALPTGTGTLTEFLGSSTGPSYTEQECSPIQATWSVRPQCAKVSIQSLSAWCAGNVFDEDGAHGVRELVTDPRLLAEIE